MIAPAQSYPTNGHPPVREKDTACENASERNWALANGDSRPRTKIDNTSIGGRVTQTVGSYPLAAIAAAAVVGIAAGWFVKRKS